MSDSAASPLRGPRQFAVARRMALGIAVLYAVFSTLWIVTSDRLLPVLGGSPEQIAWLGTVKGVLFVLVTSSLIYALLRLAPRTAEKVGIPRTHGLLLAAIFALLAAAILAIGYQVQQHGLRSVEARFFASLRAVTDSKARQVEDWLGAQSRQVTAIATSHAVVDHGSAALEGDPGAHRELVAELQAMAAAFGLDAIAVADALGNPLLAAGRTPDPGLLAPAIADAKRRQPGFSGARQGTDGMSRGAFALPLPRRELDDPGRRYLVAVVDLERTLKPLVSRWSLADSAGESTLASLGPGGELVLLPGFRSPLGGGQAIRHPTREPVEASGYARRDTAGVYEGYFEGGRPVVVAFSRVPGVDWIVVSAIRMEAALAGAPGLMRNTALVVLVALAVAGWLILALFRQQQALGRVALAHVVREREALDQHFSYLTRFANDIVLLMDCEGRIINCNDRALRAYGYTREELLGLNVFDLRPAGLVDAAQRQFGIVKSHGGLVFETWHRRKDGGEFPVEVSSRSFEVDGEAFVQSIVRDITERKRAEEALQLSEQRFRNTFNLNAVGMTHIASDGRFLMVNARAAELLGYSVAELEQLGIRQVVLAEDLPVALKQFEALQVGRIEEYTLDLRCRRKDLGLIWLHLTVSAVRDPLGEFQYSLGVIEDIGPRKRLEAQLKRRTLLYRTLSETNRAIARAKDLESMLAEACRIAVDHAGLQVAAVVRCVSDSSGASVRAAAGDRARELAAALVALQPRNPLFPSRDEQGGRAEPEVVNDVESAAVGAGTRLACLRHGIRSCMSFPLGDADKPSARLAVFSAEPGYFEGDTLDLLSDMARDLSTAVIRFEERSARELAELRLREVGARMTTLVDSAPVAVIDFDAEGKVLDVWNGAAERMFGWRRDEVIGRRLPFVQANASDQAQFDALRAQVLRGESFSGVEVTRQRRDGSPIHLSLSASPTVDSTGRPAVLAMAEDITLRREAAEEMRRARDELEQRVRERTAELAAALDRAEVADRIKTAFLASMSHELRTPLNSIIGFSSLLLAGAPGPTNEEQAKQLAIIRDAGARLLALIEDVLDISRLQAVDAQLPREATPLKDLILRVASVFQPQATGRGLSLTTRIEPCVAMAEPRRLEQILRNLVGNAVKYTDAGGVTVHCRRVESFVEIAVEDTGPGIGPEELNRLFVPFAQLKRSDSGREGTGLGLAISRRLVEAMGGNIDVDSEPGRGSVFTLRLEAAGA